MKLCPNPRCRVDHDLIFEMLLEGYDSDNWQYAVKIIRNCKECAKAVKEHFEELCKLIP